MSEHDRRPLVAGNWKMNGLQQDGLALARAVANEMPKPGPEILICPPATLVNAIAQCVEGSSVLVGGQDCHPATSGAHTGDISAEMLVDAGATHVILGHSERRQDHGETSPDIRAKLTAAHDAGLVAIVCIGETLAERDAGQTLDILSAQLEASLTPAGDHRVTAGNTVIAYEPIWAIGTGRTPSLDDVGVAHAHIRSFLATLIAAEAGGMRLLYGGSVKPGNAEELLAIADVDGALVGGASLQAEDFCAIAAAAHS